MEFEASLEQFVTKQVCDKCKLHILEYVLMFNPSDSFTETVSQVVT